MKITELRTKLVEAPPGELLEASRKTGVSYETIRRIKVGVTMHPRVDTFDKLVQYYADKAA